MIISFKFFDKEKWSLHATFITLIILIIFKLGFKSINKLNILILASIISMITPDTNLLTKLIFVFFLCLLSWNKKEFIIGTTLALLSVIVTYYIPINNPITQLSINNIFIKYTNIVFIILWFLLISYKIIKLLL
jgi:hypothetical protein